MREIEFEIFLDKFGFERMRVRLKTKDGILVDCVYQYESLINGKWVSIVRYDCAHGFFHRDVIYPNGTKEKSEMNFDSLIH